MKRWIIAGTLFLALALPGANGEENVFKPEFGLNFVISSDYHDTLEETYDSVTGGYGWMGLQLGLRCKMAEQVQIIPRIGLLFNYVTSVGAGEDNFFNTIVQPALGARLLFTKGSSFYIEGEVSYNNIDMGSDHIDADDGSGYAGIIGYQSEEGFDFGVGYSVISTDVTTKEGIDEKNFGGFEIRLKREF